MRESTRLSDRELETALTALGRSLDFPERDIASTVRQRIESRPFRQSAPSRRVAVAIAGATAIVFFAAAMMGSPAARKAVADLLGLKGVGIRYGDSPPSVPTQSPDLGLGERVTLEQARTRAAFEILTPAATETSDPDEIYFSSTPPGGQVAFIYGPRPGLPQTAEPRVAVLVTQFRGQVERESMSKVVGSGTLIEPVTVNGSEGLWLEGEPHFFFYRDERGSVRQETIRLASNTLLWEVGGLTLRLESGLSKQEALRWAGYFE
ncbi:MAG: hypothetical protein ABIS18_06245 [Actinomycetota bacterium]